MQSAASFVIGVGLPVDGGFTAQGQSPPGMQAAPGGSSKTIIDPAPARR
jgi:hypothetical protein